MFKVKATVANVMGNTDLYPCHFDHKIGDEVIWTGAELIGRVCPSVLGLLTPKILDLYAAGPRWVDSGHYLPFWFSTASPLDPSMKKYDGIGFKPLLETIEEPKYHMANLRDPRSFTWPPFQERTVEKDIQVLCPDLRTGVIFKLEAFDIADDGDSITYYRRMMVMMDRMKTSPGLTVDQILDLFSKEEREGIHPVLTPIMIQCLVEELALLDYLQVDNGKAGVTEKGVKKVQEFIKKLSTEERDALKI